MNFKFEQVEKNGRESAADFELGISGFNYSDLFDALKLKELAERFYAEIRETDADLGDALAGYIDARGENFEPRAESKILTDAAPYLSDFIARLFKITDSRENLQRQILEVDPLWKYKFFVQRRAIRSFKQESVKELNENKLTEAVNQLVNHAFSDSLVYDRELQIASVTAKLLDAEEQLTKGDGLNKSGKDTVAKIQKTFDSFADKSFGELFSANVILTKFRIKKVIIISLVFFIINIYYLS